MDRTKINIYFRVDFNLKILVLLYILGFKITNFPIGNVSLLKGFRPDVHMCTQSDVKRAATLSYLAHFDFGAPFPSQDFPNFERDISGCNFSKEMYHFWKVFDQMCTFVQRVAPKETPY